MIVLLNPYHVLLALADFHPDVLALPLLGTALLAAETGRRWLLVAAAAGLLLVREDFGLAVAGLGLYLVAGQRDYRLGLALLAGGLLYVTCLIGLVIPAIAGRPYPFGNLNPDLGSGPVGLLAGSLTDPLAALRHLASPPRPEYLVWLLGPVIGLPLLRPIRLLPGLPLLVRNLLAAHPSRVWINHHYHAAILPVILFATLGALAGLPRPWARRLAVGALVGTVVFDGYALIGLLGSEIPLEPTAEAATYRAALRLIPAEGAVAASNRLGAHLGDRRRLWFFPADDELLADPSHAEWVAVDLADRPGWLLEQSDQELQARLLRTYPPDRFDEVVRSGSVVVLRRED